MAKRLDRDPLAWMEQSTELPKSNNNLEPPVIEKSSNTFSEKKDEQEGSIEIEKDSLATYRETPIDKARKDKSEPKVEKSKKRIKKNWIQGCYYIYPEILESMYLLSVQTTPRLELSEIVNEALKSYLSDRGVYKKKLVKP